LTNKNWQFRIFDNKNKIKLKFFKFKKRMLMWIGEKKWNFVVT